MRKETYRQYKALPAYPTVIRGRFDTVEWTADLQRRKDFFDAQVAHLWTADHLDSANVITGSPGSAGRVEGSCDA